MTILPQSIAPFVPARDRLVRWTTPYALLRSSLLRQRLGDRAFEHMQIVKLASVEWKTLEGYGAGLLRFTQYCDALGISEEDRMPAPEWLLAGFASSGAAKVGSADHWIDGLKMWHEIHGAQWLGRVELGRVLTGVKKLAPPSSRRPQRPPVTFEHIDALRLGLDFTNSFDVAVWAAASVAFWSCCRLGEVLIGGEKDFDPLKHVSRGAPLSFGRTRDGTQFATLHIPFSKTTGNQGADISITEFDEPSNPFFALKFHLKQNADVPDEAPFFSFVHGDSWLPLTKPWFLERCNVIWAAAGLDILPDGHSFRIGGCTELLLRGTPPHVVAKQGRWRSDAFLVYWRKIESIVPFFISRAFYSEAVSRMSSAMNDFSITYNRRTHSHT